MSNIGGHIVAKSLFENDISTIFTLVGNQISPILTELYYYNISAIDVRHEQAAIHMADAYSQTSRDIGVAIVSGGPGFTNSITGIMKCYFSQTPLLVIVGAPSNRGKDIGGLQDMDQLLIIKPYSKSALHCNDVSRIPEYISRSIAIAKSGKMGPAILEIPLNILKDENKKYSNPILTNKLYLNTCCASAGYELYSNIANKLLDSKRPIILVGDECYFQKCESSIEKLIQILKIPVFTLNKARGLLSDSNDFCMGNGRVIDGGHCNKIYPQADLVLCLGLVIDYQIGHLAAPYFSENVESIIINQSPDLNPHAIGIKLTTNINSFVENLTYVLKKKGPISYQNWLKKILTIKSQFFNKLHKQKKLYSGIHPIDIFNIINKYDNGKFKYVLDGSNSMFWASSLVSCHKPGVLTIAPDGQLGPMGAGLPLALATKLFDQDEIIILYTGDGSFGFNIMEIETAIKYDIPIIIIIHNDNEWGFCKSTQENLYKTCANTELNNSNYSKIVDSFGGVGINVLSQDEFETAFQQAIISKKITCININIDSSLFSPGSIEFNKIITKR